MISPSPIWWASKPHGVARTSQLYTFFKPRSRPDIFTDASPRTIFRRTMFYSKVWVGRGSSCHSHRSYFNDYFVHNQDQALSAIHYFSLQPSLPVCAVELKELLFCSWSSKCTWRRMLCSFTASVMITFHLEVNNVSLSHNRDPGALACCTSSDWYRAFIRTSTQGMLIMEKVFQSVTKAT